MIKLKNISVSFDGRKVLDNLSFEFKDKGIVLITGASGSGKTTLLNVILGLLKVDNGSVDLNGSKISAVFQEDRLVPTLTAAGNVSLVSNKEEAKKRLTEVNLADSLNFYPHELSGGMKRRVALARALSYPSDVLVLDEAFAGIDDPLAKRLIEQITKEYSERLIIAVTHRPELFEGVEHSVLSL